MDILTIGESGVSQGILRLWNGPGEVMPATIGLANANGEMRFLHATAAGQLYMSDEVPEADEEGEAVGAQ